MNARAIDIRAKKNKRIGIKVYPGHFATSSSHVNYYLDMTDIKAFYKKAKLCAEEFGKYYAGIPVDTIICLEGTRIVGAYLAEELAQTSIAGINQGADIAVVTPEINSNNQMFFRDNVQPLIWNKRVLVMVASITTGKTISRAMECIQYYSGQPSGVCALFSAEDEIAGLPIHSIFTQNDLQDYQNFAPHDCPACKENKKIDAMVNSYGYTRL